MNLAINDLAQNNELDAQAMANLAGGSTRYVGTTITGGYRSESSRGTSYGGWWNAGFLKKCRYVYKYFKKTTVKYGYRKYKQCKFGIA